MSWPRMAWYHGALPAALLAVAPAAASTPSPPPPWERGFVISEWLVLCALFEPNRYSSCAMRHEDGPLQVVVTVRDGPTSYKLRRSCAPDGSRYLEREGEVGTGGLVVSVKRAVAEIAAADCSGDGEEPRMPEHREEFYERMNLIFLLMKSF